MRPFFTLGLVFSVLLTLSGCGPKKPAVVVLPPLGQPQTLEAGVLQYEVSLPHGDKKSRLWIYVPANPKSAKIPCLFVAPAGSHMFDGASLGDGDRPEHLPYVRAGYAVVAYEVDGDQPEHPTDQQIVDSAQAFKDADAGIANARSAIDYALAKVPQIDPKRLYSAGHSSAATLSLLAAEYDPRIAACIAYAPVCDVPKHLGEKFITAFEAVIPGYREFMSLSSPNSHTEKLRCPLFLFHADDDTVVKAEDVDPFAALVKQTNPNVTYTTVPNGNHYESMVNQGIPDALEWLGKLPASK